MKIFGVTIFTKKSIANALTIRSKAEKERIYFEKVMELLKLRITDIDSKPMTFSNERTTASLLIQDLQIYLDLYHPSTPKQKRWAKSMECWFDKE